MSVQLEINGRKIGGDAPVFVIAEACDNHLGDMKKAREMILQSKLAGADCVKFQHHLVDEEMLKDCEMSDNFDEHLYDFLKKYSLTLDQHRELKSYAKEVGIEYLCTPFSLKAAQELDSIGLKAFKIGSGEMTDIPSLVKIGALGHPMMVSTGMSTYEEIDRTYTALTSRNVPLCLLNCVSEYPPVYEDINLNVIDVMRERYPEAVIGHSDHTPDLYTCFAAVTLGAKVIEKHVILDKRQMGPDRDVSIDFRDLKDLVDGTRKIEVALGREKKVHEKEKKVREWAFRSLVITKGVRKGDVLTEENLWSKRPGTGIPSWKMDEVLGKPVARDIEPNTLLSWEDLQK